MTEDVGKIRIGCEVDSSGAKRGIDDLYKAIRSLNKSINSLISSKSISIGLQLENNAESALLNEVTRVTDNISKNAKVSIDFRVDGDGLEKVSAGVFSIADTLSKSVSTEVDIKKYTDGLYDLEYIVNRITYSDKASKFFKSLSGDIASFCAKVAPFMPGVDKYTIVLNNLAVCVNNLSDVGDGASNFFKSLKKYNTALSKVGDMNNSAGLFVQSMQTLSDGVSSLRSAGDVSGTLKPIKSTIGLLNKVNDMSIDTTKADSISNSLKSLGEGVSLLRGSGDVSGSLKPVRSTIGLLNKVNDISVDTTKTESISNSLKSLGEGVLSLRNAGDISGNLGSFKLIFKLLNKVNDISVDATKTESMSNSLKLLGEGVSSLRDAGDISGNLGSFKLAFKLLNKINDMSVDATKVGSISNSLKALSEGVSSLSTVGDISESLGYIKSTLKILNKLNETNVDSSQVESIGSSISALVSTISSIKVPKKAANVLSLMNSVKGVLMGIKEIGSADSNIDVSKISSIIVALMNTFASIDVPNSGEDITKLMESIKGIASIFTVIGKLDTGSIDNTKIEAIATSVSNLVSRLSSINIPENAAQIIELANAIKTLSSASAGTSNSSKTTSLFDRLSSGAGKTLGVIRNLIGVVKNLHSKIKGVHTVADKMGNAIKKSYTELYSKIKLITGAVKTFINTFKNMDSAYSKQLSAETRLSVAMSNSTNATKEQIQEIKDLTAEYQQLGILGDEVQLTGLQELSTYVESTESIKKLLPIMNDMTAQQFGFEATTENAFTIATALGKVLNGNTDTLKRYGYAFNDAQKQILKYGAEEQKVAVLTEVVSSAVGGMNSAMANTPTGRITQLKNNFGDLKEVIGELLNYVVLPFTKSINDIILRTMQGVKSLTEFIKEALGIKTVTKEVKTLLDTSSNKTANSLDGVSDSLDDAASSADNTKKKVKNLLGSFDELNILSEDTSSNLDDSSDALDSLSLGQGVTDTIEVPDLGDFKKRLSALFDSLDFEKLGLNFAEKINEYIGKWNPAASGAALADKLNKLIKFANAGLKKINFKQLGQKIGTWINNFVGKFDSKKLGNTIATLINQAVAFANGLLTETDFKKLGESIGTFISGLFTDIDYVALADLIINAVEAAVDTAAGIISKIDFNGIGKGLAQGVNRLSRANSTWTNAAHVLSDAIVGILDLATTFLNETDFEALGYAIGDFISKIKWKDVLMAAGEALWAAFKAVLDLTKGVFDGNAIAGSIVALVEALVLIKGLTGVAGTIGGIVSALGGFKTIAFVAIATGILAVGNAIAQAGNDAFNSKLTSVLNSDIPAAEEDLNTAVEKIGLDFDNIVSSATSNGFLLNQETGKMIGYVDNMRIEIDAKTGEISGYYERLKLGDLPEVFGSAVDSMSAKFDPNSTFVSNFKDGKQKVTDLQEEIKGIAPTIVHAGDDTDAAVENLILALDKLKTATNEAKQSASNLILAYTSSSRELLEKNGVDINAIYSDINKATNYSKNLTDEQIERFKELAKKVSEGKQLTEQEATDYNELLNTITGGNVKALQENKKELADYLDAIQNGRITFSDADEAKAVIEDITAKYKDASGKLSDYSEEINSAIETLELPDDIKKSYKEMFGNLLTVDQAELDTIFMNTKHAIGNELMTLYEEIGKGGYFKQAKASLYFKDAMDAAKVTGEDFVGHISDGLTSSYNTTYLPAVQTFFSDASDDIKSEARGTIAAFVGSLNDNVKNSADSLKEESKKLGEYTDDGLVEGLNKNKKKVNDASKDIAAIPGLKLKEYNEISSPSKLTKRYGEYIDEGLVLGLKSGIKKIEAMSKKIASTVVDELKIKSSQITILKTYGYNYIDSFFKGIILKGNELNKIVDILKKVINTFKITGTNSNILTKYGNTYVNDYIKGVVLSDTNKKKVSDIQTIIITLLRPSASTLNSAKNYGSSILQNMINGMTVSDNNKISISNAGITIYNSMINSMNGLTGKLNTSSANFIGYLTNPITNGLKLLLDSMDLFYVKFRDKWQGVANLFNNKFIAGSMGVAKVPNLNDNYYPFGNNIVKLAQGAVIKPNNEFMAILGDQKRGLNIETPLATMKQAFIEALNDGGYSGGNITIPVYIGNEKIDTLIVNSNNRRGMRNNGRV